MQFGTFRKHVFNNPYVGHIYRIRSALRFCKTASKVKMHICKISTRLAHNYSETNKCNASIIQPDTRKAVFAYKRTWVLEITLVCAYWGMCGK